MPKIETIGAIAMMVVGGTGLAVVLRKADKFLREDAALETTRHRQQKEESTP